MFNIVETKERITADNELEAEKVRINMRENRTFFVNLMGSPGAGKTSVLLAVIKQLKEKYNIAVMEADVDSDEDARTINETGVKVIQLHTAGLCHMDADMTKRGLDALGIDGVDLVFLENIGNLVCPAEFDVGANVNVMILSAPEGDDKPLKYPLMFKVSDCLLLNKIDTSEVFGFDPEKATARATELNENIEIIEISAINDYNIDKFTAWLEGKMQEVTL